MSRVPLFLVACVGCVISEPAVTTTTQALVYEDGCPPKQCGSNSSAVNGVHFYELSTQLGVPNSEGVSVVGYLGLPPGATRLDVRKNELVARNAMGFEVAWGPQLVGAGYMLQVNGQAVPLVVTDYHRTLHYWAADDGKPLSSYTFTYYVLDPKLGTVAKPLCTVVDVADGVAALDAFVFEGDRYDPDTKVITTGAATKGWYNIACLSGAPGKNYRMRAASASSDFTAGITTTLAERQALFNLWTANYCGDGKPFTVPGEPLRVRDAKSWIKHTSAWSWDKESQLDSFEAVWGPDGARCLDMPRRDDSAPGYRDVIAEHCESVGHPLPKCDDLGASAMQWPLAGAYVSANPTGS